MKPHQRAAYLRALGVEVWVPKAALALSPSRDALEQVDVCSSAGNDMVPFSAASTFFVEPGTGDTLLLCGSQDEAGTILARDISRSLKVQPLWGWPVSKIGRRRDPAGGHSRSVDNEAHCFRGRAWRTELANLDGEKSAGVIGTAEALRVASLPQLASSGKARRALWETLDLRQWCATRASVFSLSPAGEIEA